MNKRIEEKSLTYYTILILILVGNLTFAQNNWKTTGNGLAFPDAVTSSSFLGTTITVPLNLKTTQAQPINFFTNNTERMRIRGIGLVGIGNTNNFLAASLLHLNQSTPLPLLHNS